MNSCLEAAWKWREKRALIEASEALRVFHGPGEGTGPFNHIMIDRFGAHYWIAQREGSENDDSWVDEVRSFLQSKGAKSAVLLRRPKRGVSETTEVLWGDPPAEGAVVSENGLKFKIKFLQTRHPGLFLDHAPLRRWLARNTQGREVLNAFAYTGSLSVAAAQGGALKVTTLDLSSPSIQWARENWELNGLPEGAAEWRVGDVFEWLPRFNKSGRKFGCIILDPPSFSRGNKGEFSTAKDLALLHTLAFQILAPEGILVTSINSSKVSERKFESEVRAAAQDVGIQLQQLGKIQLPETFPSPIGDSEGPYLKGFILKSTR